MRLFTVLRIFRAFKGYKIGQLAKEIGISPRALAQIEDGQIPKGDTLVRVLIWAMSEENQTKPTEPKKEGELFNGTS